MSRAIALSFTLLTMLMVASASTAPASTQSKAYAEFDGAEERFQSPAAGWFEETQAALREEVQRVSLALDARGAQYADNWKSYLHWELLERNLGPSSTVNRTELELVRRWLYSNRRGLETPFFAQLRQRIDAHLDAVFSFSHADLRATFVENVALARRQCLALAEDPSDSNAAELGRTLGWFERTRQLAAEVAKVRSLASLPNAQVIVADPLIGRIMATQFTEVAETVMIINQVNVPPSIPLQRSRTLCVRGSANSTGRVELALTPNHQVAELSIVYQGSINSTCRAVTGPVTLHLRTTGTTRAVKPIYFSPIGLRVGQTSVFPQVTSTVTAISARSELVRRVGGRRANQPESRAMMDAEGRSMTIENVTSELDERVESAIGKIETDFKQLQETLGGFGEVLAPLAREGATPYFHGARSSADGIELNAAARARDQFGAAIPCAIASIDADILVRVHVSAVNNMAETITGGKSLSDAFFMKYAEILHEELPLSLMVHARARRWAIVTRKHRPFEVRIPKPNRFLFRIQIESLEIDGEQFAAPSSVAIAYDLTKNGIGEYQLERDGGVQLETTLEEEARSFLHEKLDAFFGPVLNAGGVVIPDGGLLGALKGLEPRGIHAESGWIVAGVNVPTAIIEQLMQLRQGGTEAP